MIPWSQPRFSTPSAGLQCVVRISLKIRKVHHRSMGQHLNINSYGLEPDEPHLRNSAIMCHVQIRETGSIKGNQLGMVQTPMEELRYPKSHQVVAPCQVQHQVGSIRASQTRHLMILMVPKSWTHQNSASSASGRIMVKWSIFQIRLEYLYNHLTIQRLFQ